MTYTVETQTTTHSVSGRPRLTFRQIIEQLPAPPDFPIMINGWKVLARSNLDTTLPAEWSV